MERASIAATGAAMLRKAGSIGSSSCLLLVVAAAVCALAQAAANAQASQASEEQILLAFAASVENWNEVFAARSMEGWAACQPEDCKPICGWSGVHCDPFSSANGDHVTDLELPCNGCPVRAVGKLLPALASLQYLQTLDLSGNAFYGDLPPEWGHIETFPKLIKLNLNSNNISGPLPEEWAVNAAFLSLVELHLSSNRLSGPISYSWANTNTSFVNLLVWNMANNQLSGTLPEIVNGMVTMSQVAWHNNRFTGHLPPGWGIQGYFYNNTYNTTQELRELFLHGNQLTGGLPVEWGARDSFTVLKKLTLSSNPLASTLPPSWGTQEGWQMLSMLNISDSQLVGPLPEAWGQGMPSLRTLAMDDNYLTGTFPESWASMPALSTVYVNPGNPGLCMQLPDGASFNLCHEWEPLCSEPLQSSNSTACTSGPGSPTSSSSVPVAAIVAPVVAVAAVAAMAGALFITYRRRRRQRVMQPQQGQSKAVGPASALGPLPTRGDWGAAGQYPSPAFQFHTEGSVWAGQQGGAAASKVPVARFPSAELLAPSTATPPHEQPLSRSMRALNWAGKRCLPCAWGPALDADGHPHAGQHSSGGGPSEGPLGPSVCHGHPSHYHNSGASSLHTASIQPNSGSMVEIAKTASGSQNLQAQQLGGSGGNSGEGSANAASGAKSAFCQKLEKEADLYKFDFDIRPEEIEIMRRPDGSLWELGAGGFGRVYKAMRNGVQPVAVKLLGPPQGPWSRADELEFQHEIALLRACRDTNILQFQGVCLQAEGAMLVTEYMEGGNLLVNIRLGKVNWYRRGKRIAIEVARALAYLHSRRIIHFDVKSANVLLTKEGSAKLGDVGMSKRILNSSKACITGSVGTLAWSAPEMLLGYKCTTKADIYSFGIVLWEIVSGEQPMRGQLRDVSVPEECPDEVRELILLCLEPNPGARPTAVQLVEWLQQAPAMPQSKSALSFEARKESPAASTASHPPSAPPSSAPSLQQVEVEQQQNEESHQLAPQELVRQLAPIAEAVSGIPAASPFGAERAQHELQHVQQHGEALAPAQSLSFSSPFAAQTQQPWPVMSREGSMHGGSVHGGRHASVAGAGTGPGRLSPSQLMARLSGIRQQRSTSGLLPVQDGLDERQGPMASSSPQLPMPFGKE